MEYIGLCLDKAVRLRYKIKGSELQKTNCLRGALHSNRADNHYCQLQLQTVNPFHKLNPVHFRHIDIQKHDIILPRILADFVVGLQPVACHIANDESII